MKGAARGELLRRLDTRPDDETGFDPANIRRVLEGPEEVATGGTWTPEGWERFAEAVERIASTKLREERADGKIAWTFEDGSQLSDEYLADARAIVHGSPLVVAEVERLRTMVEAAGLVFNAHERRVMGLIVAGLELLAIDPCGHAPGENLDDHCPSCRMRSALAAFGHGRSGPAASPATID